MSSSVIAARAVALQAGRTYLLFLAAFPDAPASLLTGWVLSKDLPSCPVYPAHSVHCGPVNGWTARVPR